MWVEFAFSLFLRHQASLLPAQNLNGINILSFTTAFPISQLLMGLTSPPSPLFTPLPFCPHSPSNYYSAQCALYHYFYATTFYQPLQSAVLTVQYICFWNSLDFRRFNFPLCHFHRKNGVVINSPTAPKLTLPFECNDFNTKCALSWSDLPFCSSSLHVCFWCKRRKFRSVVSCIFFSSLFLFIFMLFVSAGKRQRCTMQKIKVNTAHRHSFRHFIWCKSAHDRMFQKITSPIGNFPNVLPPSDT